MRRRLIGSVLAAHLLLGASVAVPPIALAAAGPDPCADIEALATLPASAAYGYGTEVVRTDGRPAWILGMSAGRRSPGRPIALRWSGGQWRETDVPWRGSVTGFVGGTGDKRRAWAVGFRRPGSSLQPIVGRWAGGRWRAVSVPVLPRSGATLVDVATLPDGSVWLVGAAYGNGRVTPLAVRGLAGAWSREDPATGSSSSAITAVEVGPDGGLWIGGWRLKDGRPRPFVAYRVDDAWTLLPSTGRRTNAGAVTDLAFDAAGALWVAGYAVDPDTERHVATLHRWDATVWYRDPSPWADEPSAVPRAMDIGADGTMAVAGQEPSRNRGREVGFQAVLRSDAWSYQLIGNRGSSHWEVFDTAVLDGAVLSVGGRSNRMVVTATCLPAVPKGARTPTASTPTVRAGDRRSQDEPHDSGPRTIPILWNDIAAEFTGDERQDLFDNHHNIRPPQLFRGTASGYRLVEEARFERRDHHGCAAADIDDDGARDIVCNVGANHGYITKSTSLWLAPGTVGPDPKAATWGVVDPFGRGRQATFLHLDDDQRHDLYLTSEPERVDVMPSINRLFRNVDGTHFAAAPEAGADLPTGGACASGADLDGDGDDELLLCTTQRWKGADAGLRVLWNDGGRFRDRTASLGVRPVGDLDALAVDLDADGRLDLVQLSGQELRVSLRIGRGFTVVERRPVTQGVAVAARDADGDGRQDLVIERDGRGRRNDLVLLNLAGGRRFRTAPATAALTVVDR